MPRVRIPELRVGPPLERWRGERIVQVPAKEAARLVAEEAGEILEAEKAEKKSSAKN